MSARVRISAIRLKAGGEVRLLRLGVHEGRSRTERDVREVLDQHIGQTGKDLTGFVFVVWDADFTSTVGIWNAPASPMPSITIPDFIRNRLLAAKIEDWTIGTINGQNGYFPTDGAS